MDQQKSIVFNGGQHVHFSWNRQANDINIRIIPIIPTPNLLNFQIFPAPNYSHPHLFTFRDFSTPPP